MISHRYEWRWDVICGDIMDVYVGASISIRTTVLQNAPFFCGLHLHLSQEMSTSTCIGEEDKGPALYVATSSTTAILYVASQAAAIIAPLPSRAPSPCDVTLLPTRLLSTHHHRNTSTAVVTKIIPSTSSPCLRISIILPSSKSRWHPDKPPLLYIFINCSTVICLP